MVNDILLKHFIGEDIAIITNATLVVAMEDHDEEAPMIFSGILVDYDDKFLMIGDEAEGPSQLISREHIVQIKHNYEQAPEGAVFN